jgi:hypothetical protein
MLGMLAAALVHVSAAAAQPTQVIRVPLTSFVSCDQTPPAEDAYDHCALYFVHHSLRRGRLGTPGTELTRSEFLHPAPLSRYVLGDSALVYASRYELDTRRGEWLAVMGTGMMFTSLFMAHRQCSDLLCSHDALKLRSRVLLIGGGVVTGVSLHYIKRGVQAANRALWWSNKMLPHRGS